MLLVCVCLACSGRVEGGGDFASAGSGPVNQPAASAGTAGSAGAPAVSGGAPAAAGNGSSGAPVQAAAGGAGGQPNPAEPPVEAECQPWPQASETVEVDDTIEVEESFDGELQRFVGTGALGSDSQDENQPAFFSLSDGAVLKNVILGGPAADGIHCRGSCTLQNVWFEDVGEDAATLDGDSAAQIMTVECAGARQAADKVFQHNGPGTMILRDVYAEDFGKLYRSCGNCQEQYERHAELERIVAEHGLVIAGVNENYGDSVTFDDITTDGEIEICWRYQANDSGAEPDFIDGGADGQHCLYDDADIHEL